MFDFIIFHSHSLILGFTLVAIARTAKRSLGCQTGWLVYKSIGRLDLRLVGIKLTNLAMVGKIPNWPGVERGIILVSATPARAPMGSGLKLIFLQYK